MALTPAQIDKLKAAILADPCFLVEHVLRREVRWFHRLWIEWTIRHPFSMIEGPRGGGKSFVSTVALVVWFVLRDPNVRILVVSKTDDAATAFTREVRTIFEENEILRQCFGDFVGRATWTDSALTVSQRTAIFPECTVEARGLGGQVARTHWNRIFIDDPQDRERAQSEHYSKDDIEWYKETLRPTLIPGGGIYLRATCYEYFDLRGWVERLPGTRVYNAEDVRLGGPLPNAKWAVLKTAAIQRDGGSFWPERFPIQDTVDPETGAITVGLETQRAEDVAVFERQYQQICLEPPKKGERETIYRREWIRPWTAAPDFAKLAIFMRVDPAFRDAEEAARRKSKKQRDPDYFAIAVVGFDYHAPSGVKSYVLDLYRDRLTPVEREQATLAMALKWKPKLVEVERTGLQIKEAPEFYDSILDGLPCPARFGQPKVNKVARAQPLAAAMNRGEVEWNPDVVARQTWICDELVEFPFGLHDDGADAISAAYILGNRRPSGGFSHYRQFHGGGAGGAAAQARTASAGAVAAAAARTSGGGWAGAGVWGGRA